MSEPARCEEPNRRDEPPAAPDAAPPEEPQTSVHEQPIQPEREEGAESDGPAG